MGETSKARAGEHLDADKLLAYLHTHLQSSTGEISVEQFPAGSSNLTYLVRVGDDEYVLRRPPFGNTVRTAHDMNREYQVLSKLSAVYGPAPKPLNYCDDVSVIGSEFYLMERRNGLILRGTSPPELNRSADLQREVCESFIKNLAGLHAIDHDAAGLGSLGKPEGYCRRQVEGWTKRYFAAKTDELPELELVIAWLNANVPTESGATLVHNDYKFDNIMLDPSDLTKVTAVLDWEMVTVGDPLMDLGTTLGYWMSPDAGDAMLSMPFNPRVLMENVTRADLAEMYAAASGRDVSNILFYYIYGTFKIAVIAQQIYARYVKGFTADPRFANFDLFVANLAKIGKEAIKRRSI
ncbi:MAG: phosphotransferase family protein [Pyrinomonadaceae bacterium]